MSKEVEEAIKDCKDLIEEYLSCSIIGANMHVDVSFDEKRCKSIEILINHIKELEEEKRITELTRISCCTAQNCAALENAIREGLENDKLKKELADSTSNEVIREKLEELKAKCGGNVFHIQQTINAEISLLEEILEGEKK